MIEYDKPLPPPPPIEVPGLPDMVHNLAAAGVEAVRHAVKTGVVMVSSQEKQARLDICASCEFFKEGRCMKCGCFMKVKASLSIGKCPIGKW